MGVTNQTIEDRIVKIDEVEQLTQIPRSTLYKMKAAGDLPEPVKLGVRKYGFWLSDIIEWLENRRQSA